MGKILRRLYEYKGVKIIEGTSDERSREYAGKHTTENISVLSFMGYIWMGKVHWWCLTLFETNILNIK